MFVYVALGADATPPGGLRLFSRTSFERLRDAWARFGPPGWLPPLLVAGVDAPLVDRPSSLAGVALPLPSWGVASAEASLLDASPTIALRFLLRRWFGFQWGFRKFLWMACMSSCSRSS